MNKDEAAARLSQAFDLLDAISVRGDDVERMAAARATLKALYHDLTVKHEYDAKGAEDNGG